MKSEIRNRRPNRVAGRIDLPAPLPPDMRVRIRRFITRMSRFHHFWLLTFLLFCVAGCSRTYIGDGQGTASPDGQLRLSVTSHGAYRHAYIDKTKKDVWISVWRAGTQTQQPLFQHSYQIVGSDVSWDTRWLSSSNVVVQFFDYGDGVISSDGGGLFGAPTDAPTHQIRTIRFRVDGQTGKVNEDKNAG